MMILFCFHTPPPSVLSRLFHNFATIFFIDTIDKILYKRKDRTVRAMIFRAENVKKSAEMVLVFSKILGIILSIKNSGM
jgi:hypothetical protein